MTTKTTDLGQGWYANLTRNVAGIETLTIRNPDKGQRIDLGTESIDALRAIFAKADTYHADRFMAAENLHREG